jgi:hypothetical protein
MTQPAPTAAAAATEALIQHFVSGQAFVPLSVNQIQDMAARSSWQSSENVRRLLQLSRSAADERRAALGQISTALDSNSLTDLDVNLDLLEQRVAAARMEMEKVAK